MSTPTPFRLGPPNPHDLAYHGLLETILGDGVQKGDRTGVGTISVFGVQAKFDLRKGFPLLTTKEMAWKHIVSELLWFISGDTNVRTLALQGNKIWHGNGYDFYRKRTAPARGVEPVDFKEWSQLLIDDPEFASWAGTLGEVYGAQWRRWPNPDGTKIDQLANLLKRLVEKPDDRRLIVSAWNPSEVDSMALPPCHAFWQLWTKPLSLAERQEIAGESLDEEQLNAQNIPTRRLDCLLYQRSCDTFLGVPFNIASYALLTHLIANQVGMQAGVFTHHYGDLHIYRNHLEQVKTQLSREPFSPPTLKLKSKGKSIFDITAEDIVLEGYQSHQRIKAEMAV